MFEDWRGPLWWQEAGLVFIWPLLLWLLLLIPMGMVAYRLMRPRHAFEFWGFSSGILVIMGLVLLISASADFHGHSRYCHRQSARATGLIDLGHCSTTNAIQFALACRSTDGRARYFWQHAR